MQLALSMPRFSLPFLLAGLIVAAGCRRADTGAATLPDFRRDGDHIVVPEGSALRHRVQLATATADSIRKKLNAPAVIEADPEKFARV